MPSEMLKQTIQGVLRYFGLELRRAGATADPFVVQRELITTAEPVIFDVGAHVGSVAAKYRALFPRASIWCFEPFLPSFQALRRNFEADPRISCHNAALSDRKGLAKLHANLASVTNSLLASDERGQSYWGEGLLDTAEEVEVNTTTVDDFVADNAISSIDILKLDVQGAEFRVLTGARDALEKQHVNLIYTELILCPTYKGQHEFHDYLRFLDSLGYELLDLFNPERSGRQLIQADIVFLSSSFKERLRQVS
jgi:FkbM family methyltransferase